MIEGVVELALHFDDSLDVGLSELGVIREEIHCLGGSPGSFGYVIVSIPMSWK